MAIDTTPEPGRNTEQGNETAPVKRRSRRVIREAAPADTASPVVASTEPSTTSAKTSAAKTPAAKSKPVTKTPKRAAPELDVLAELAPIASAPKRTRAKKAAPASAQPEAVDNESVVLKSAGTDEQPPVKKAPRRATSKKASSAQATENSESIDLAMNVFTDALDAMVAERGSEDSAGPRTRRRAASKNAKSVSDDAAAAGTAPVNTETPEDAPAKSTGRGRGNAAKNRKSRPDVGADSVATESVASEATGSEPVATAAPAKRSRSRKTATPAVETSETAPVSTESDTEAEAASAPAAAKKSPRRGTRAAKSQTAAAAEPATTELAVPDAPAVLTGVANPGATAPQESSASSQPPRLATTAVLFQAPDMGAARAKRRRATSAAGSPDEVRASVHNDAAVTSSDVEEELEVVVEAIATDPVDAISDSDPIAEGESVDEESVEASEANRRRRRRRGGRGRRNRSGNSDANDDSSDEDADSSADSNEDADSETEVDDTNASGNRNRSRNRNRREQQQRQGDNDSADEVEILAEVADGETRESDDDLDDDSAEGSSSRRRRRRRRGGRSGEDSSPAETSTRRTRERSDEVTALKGSTRLEAKRQRRREGRDAGRRRQIITEAEFLARRESVERAMIVRERAGRIQIAVLEDGVLVEHYVSQQSQASMAGNVYLGRVQNVLPSMEAAFVDVGKGRNAVLYAGEVNWDAAGVVGQPRRIEQALKSGDSVLVQVTKDPIGHKGARLTSQVTLAGRYLVYVPGGGMTGISRKLPEPERARLKKILREIVPESAGVIVRTAAEGATEEELSADIKRLQNQWTAIEKKAKTASAPAMLHGEPDLAIRVVRDIFNDDFKSLVVSGETVWGEISAYVGDLAPDLANRITRWSKEQDVFAEHRIDEQLAKGMDRKVYLPSGGSLVIDRTEAMTVVDVNTGKFTGVGGTLEETVTRNNLEAAEEIVRQLRLRDIGGMVVVDFIDMVLESNRDLVLRRLVECLGRDRTKHQVAEVTSLGLVQMTRKRVGQGLVEAFSTTCECCHGRGFIVHDDPIEKGGNSTPQVAPKETEDAEEKSTKRSSSRRRKSAAVSQPAEVPVPVLPEADSEARENVKSTLAQIAAAAVHAHELAESAVVVPANSTDSPSVSQGEEAADSTATFQED